jgi:TonB family protein
MNLVTITASGVLALGLPFATPWLLQEPVPSSASTAPTTIDLSSLRGAFAQPATPAAPTSIATTANTSPVAPAAPPMVATFGAPPLVIDTRALLAPASMPGQEHHDDATIAQLAELQARIAALQAEMAELSAQRSSAGGPPLDTWPGALPRVDESEMDVEWIVDSQVEREPDVDPWPMIEQQLRRQRLAELQEHALGAAGAAAEQQRAEAQRAVAEARAQLESHGDELRARALELRELARHQAQGEREAARARNEGRRSQLLAELAQLDARMQQSNGAVEELYARLDVETEERVQAQLEARVAELEARMETLDWQIEARSDELELLDEQAYAFDSEFEGPSEWDLDTDWEFDTAGMLPDERRWAAAMDGLFAATELVDRHAGRFPGGAAGGAAGGACDEPAAVAGQPLWLDLRQPGPDTRPAATAVPNNGTVIVNVGSGGGGAGTDAEVIGLLREIRDEVRGLRADLRNLHGGPMPAAPRGSRPDFGYVPNSSSGPGVATGGGFGRGAEPFGQPQTIAPQADDLSTIGNPYGDAPAAPSGGDPNALSSVEIRAPRAIRQPAPMIDAALRAAGPATVHVNLLVSEAGAVANAAVKSSTDSRFEQAALDAATQWVFEPGSIDGQPNAMFVDVPIVFPSTSK